MKLFLFFLLFVVFLHVETKIIPPFIENLFNTLKRTVIKKAIFDSTFRVMGFRNTGHAATVMKGRVHAVEKLTALSESFKEEVDVLSDVMSKQSEALMQTITNQIANNERFHRAFRRIEQYVPIIESSFRQMLNFRVQNRNNLSEAAMEFAENVVDTSEKTVYDAINKLTAIFSGNDVINKQLSKSSLSTIVDYLESKSDKTECETIVATMETVHTFVQSMILVITKAKVVVKYGYNLKHLANNSDESTLTEEKHSYKTEIEKLEVLAMESVERILLNFMRSTENLKPYTYNCRPTDGYIENYNYERFTNFLSSYFADERFLHHPYERKAMEFFSCSQNCPMFNLSTKSDKALRFCQGLLRNCKKYAPNIKVCVKRGSNNTELFSKNVTSCPKKDIFDTKSQLTMDFFKCDTCACTCDTQIGNNFVYTGAVRAKEGHVVTGVRLRKAGTTIYLSILSGRPMPMGFVDTREAEWSELQKNVNPVKNLDKYFRISWWCRTFALTDVKLERYHVVTGVQFVVYPKKCMIGLKVYGTMINVLYGIVVPNSTVTAVGKP